MSEIIKLPKPQLESKFPLMEALKQRRTKRRFSTDELDIQEISNILWAACGETVKESKRGKSKRTAPSGRNSKCISVYITLSSGVYKYIESGHIMERVLDLDVRENIGTQKMMKDAPVGLIYVSDFSKLKGYVGTDDSRKWFVSGTETGHISQNVYLYCASSGLNTALLGLVNRGLLEDIIGFGNDKKIVYTQTVGYCPV